MTEPTGREVAVVEPQSYEMRPVMSVEAALEAWENYQALKTRVGKKEDFKKIGEKLHPMKSFVRKAQKFFGVSCEILRDEPWRDEEGATTGWICTVRAVHTPSGLHQDADGSCEFAEKNERQRTLHNIRAHALTRAKNRAILDLVGFGEVSAEEIIDEKSGRAAAKPKRGGKETAKVPPKDRGPAKANSKTPEPPEDPLWPWKPKDGESYVGKPLSEVPIEAIQTALSAPRIPAPWRERLNDEVALYEGKTTADAIRDRWAPKDD